MSRKKLKVVHYLNQFFGQIGGEDKADIGFMVKSGPVGPGLALQKALGDQAEVVATIICGDNYFSKNPELTGEEGFKLIEAYQPDLFFAGPAFAAGRYGVACGAICKAVTERLGIPALTGMYQENPGVDMYRKHAYICKTDNSARDMAECISHMVRLAFKLTSGEKEAHLVSRESLPRPDEYGYFSRIILRNEYTEKTAAERSVEKLLAKLRREPFESEVILPKFEKVESPAPIKNLGACEIILISDGGLVPKGNPDGLSGRGNLRWTKYEIETFLPERFDSSDYEIAHTGYFPVQVLEDPNRLIPVDAMREFVKEGRVGKLHPTFFSTSGNATVSRRCAEMGEEMGEEIKKRGGIDAVILTSTWGSSTRCGATIASKIEKIGIPVVQITAVPNVAQMVGANRILQGQSITCVVGNSVLTGEQERALRRKYVLRALEILQTPVESPTIFTLEGTQ